MSSSPEPAPPGNVAEGNLVGTDVSGTVAIPGFLFFGVQIYGRLATGNTIGGNAAAARNIISGNSGIGVYLAQSGTSGNVVEGNYIGTDLTGGAALGNLYGVVIVGGTRAIRSAA